MFLQHQIDCQNSWYNSKGGVVHLLDSDQAVRLPLISVQKLGITLILQALKMLLNMYALIRIVSEKEELSRRSC